LKSIALIAHDNLKLDLADFVTRNNGLFSKLDIYATKTTASLLFKKNSNLDINTVLSGPHGGDLQIGSLIASDKIDAMIFFWDPLSPQPHDVDIKALLRIAVLKNILLASNLASAEALVAYISMQAQKV